MINHVHLIGSPAREDSLVERNPVRAGMVRRAADYRWSSAASHPISPPISPISCCDRDRKFYDDLLRLSRAGFLSRCPTLSLFVFTMKTTRRTLIGQKEHGPGMTQERREPILGTMLARANAGTARALEQVHSSVRFVAG